MRFGDDPFATTNYAPRSRGMSAETTNLLTVGAVLLAAAVLAYYLEKGKFPSPWPHPPKDPALPPPPATATGGGGGYHPPAAAYHPPAAAYHPPAAAYHPAAPAAPDEDDGDDAGPQEGGQAYSHN